MVAGFVSSGADVAQELDEGLPGAVVSYYMPQTAAGQIQTYVAKGTYSLPVTLPAGEVRLDFARPAGQAQLSIWAVPLSTIRSFYATLTVVVVLLVVLGIIKIWPKKMRPFSLKRAIAYSSLFVLLTVLLGLLGLLISVFIILVSEAILAAYVRRPIVAAA
jgi:hypothetical protein